MTFQVARFRVGGCVCRSAIPGQPEVYRLASPGLWFTSRRQPGGPLRDAPSPIALWTAAVLLVVIGVSGLFISIGLLAVTDPPASGGEFAGIAIPAGIAGYGAAALVGGLGLILLLLPVVRSAVGDR